MLPAVAGLIVAEPVPVGATLTELFAGFKLTAPLPVRVPVAVRALLTVVVPELAPTLSVVAAPAKLTVVAVAFTKLKVVWLVVMLPPLT